MATVEDRRFSHVEERADLYRSAVESDVEPVIASSKIAEVCFDFADTVIQGCALYDSIRELDHDWSRLVEKTEVEHCPAYDERLNQLYGNWILTSRRALELYAPLENEYTERGFDTARVQLLRRNCHDADRILRDRSERYEALVQINSELEPRQMSLSDAAELRRAATAPFIPLGEDEAFPLPERHWQLR